LGQYFKRNGTQDTSKRGMWSEWDFIPQYTEQLKDLRQAAEDDIEVAKRRDGLEDLQVDITSIKPKFA
jgi:hypothetical protein